MAVFNVDKTQNNSELICEKGDKILLELPENPTTGFKWHIQKSDGLTLQEDQFKLDTPSNKNSMGAGGTRKLEFEFSGPRHAALHLEYYQEWEGVESSTESFKLSLRAKS